MQQSCTLDYLLGSKKDDVKAKEARRDRRVVRSIQVPIIREDYPEHQRDEVWVKLRRTDGRMERVSFSLIDGTPVQRIAGFTVDYWIHDLEIVRLTPTSLKNIRSELPLVGQTNLFDDGVVGVKLPTQKNPMLDSDDW